MSFFQAASLKFGAWPVKRVVAVMFAPFATRKQLRRTENRIDVFGVAGPIGRDVQGTAVVKSVRKQLEEIRLDDASFVVPLLGPGIGKVKIHTCQRTQRHHVREDLDRVVRNQPQVAKTRIPGLQQAVTDAWIVYLDAEEIVLWIVGRLFNQRFPVSEANFKNDWRVTSEQVGEIQCLAGVLDAKVGPKIGQCLVLGRREPSGAPHKASDAAFWGFVGVHEGANTKEESGPLPVVSAKNRIFAGCRLSPVALVGIQQYA